MNRNKRKISIIAMLIFIFSIIPTKFVQAIQNTSITSRPIATKEQAKDWAKENRATQKFIELADLYWQLYKDHGNINPAMAYTQAGVETGFGNFEEVFSETYKNPFAINRSSELISRSDDRTPYRFKSWRDGVIAHLDHLALIAGVKGYPKKAGETPDPNHNRNLYGNNSNAIDVFGIMQFDRAYGEFIMGNYNEFNIIPKPTKSKMNLEVFKVEGDTLKVRGWALHKGGASSISVSLNGHNIGYVELTKARPDVNRVFQGYPDDEKCGFEKSFDISNISPGEQELNVSVWGLDGTEISQTRKITIKRKQPKMNLEFPKANGVIEGNILNIRGWAINDSKVAQVKVFIDNEEIGVANYGLKRADVKRVFPSYKSGENVGFNGQFDLSYLSSGEKTLTVQAIGVDGSVSVRSIKINLNKKPNKMNIESPKWGATINNGVIDINGWALHGSGIHWIKLYVDDKFLGDANLEINRPDVNKAFPGYPNGDKSGFNKKVKVDDIGLGEKTIKAEVIGWDGSKFSKSVKVNLTKKVAKMNLEKPTNNGSSNGVNLKVCGWALNTSGMKEVKVYVDNEFVGNATLKQNRPDVARVFSAYEGAKDSGFTGEFNVAKFAEGNHKVKTVAIGNDGISTTMEKVVNLKKKVIVINSEYNVNSKNNINLGKTFIYNGKPYKESEVNMQLALNLKNQLSKLGYKVILTQDPYKQNNVKTDFEDVDSRLNIIKNANADMFITIQCDKDNDKKIKGTKLLYNTEEDKIITKDIIRRSAILANDLMRTITTRGRFEDRGTLNRNYYLNRMVNIPSVIVEPGFLSNDEDAKKLTNKNSQIEIATDMAKSIDKCLKEF